MNFHVRAFNALEGLTVYKILKLRNEIFVVEQACIYQDCDGKDLEGIHFYAEEEGEILSYLRVLPAGVVHEEVTIGRVVTNPDARGRGLSTALLKKAISYAKEQLHAKAVRISAQAYLLEFYGNLGFKPISESYLEDGIPHVEMMLHFEALTKDTALMIIDVQKAMFECWGGVYDGEAVLERIVRLQDAARAAGMPIIKVQHVEPGSEFDMNAATWELPDPLALKMGEFQVVKYYCDSFYKTDLSDILSQAGISKLVITGMQTEFCVDTTIRNGFSRGLTLYGVRGAHTTYDSEKMTAAQLIEYHEGIWSGRFLELLEFEAAMDFIKSYGK